MISQNFDLSLSIFRTFESEDDKIYVKLDLIF